MSVSPQAEKLIERAQKGERLSTKDRRHCVAYLSATRPDVTNTAMADLFKVSERMIRIDRMKIRQDKAELLKREDIGLVIADIALCFEKQVKDLEAGKAKCKVGSSVYLNYCKAIFNLQLEKIRALQELGYYPKNLGNMTVDKFVFKAVMGEDGSINTRPVNIDFDKSKVVDVEAAEVEPAKLEPPTMTPVELQPPVQIDVISQDFGEAL